MITKLDKHDFERIRAGYDPDPSASLSLKAEAYTSTDWFGLEQNAVFSHSWQWVCHVEKLRAPGAYVTTNVAGRSVVVIRDRDDTLRAFTMSASTGRMSCCRAMGVSAISPARITPGPTVLTAGFMWRRILLR